MKMTPELMQDWTNARVRLQERFPDLRAEDLEYIEGRELELIERISSRTGQPREIVEGVLREAGAFCPKDTAGQSPTPDSVDQSGIPENTSQSGTSALST